MLSFKKSREPDFSNSTIIHKVDLILNEQVAQRKDLSVINALLKSLIADIGIQKQVDNYFEDDDSPPQETSPQTDRKQDGI